MPDKANLRLVELDAEQLKRLLHGNVVKLDKAGIKVSIAMSKEEIGELCGEIAADYGEDEATGPLEGPDVPEDDEIA